MALEAPGHLIPRSLVVAVVPEDKVAGPGFIALPRPLTRWERSADVVAKVRRGAATAATAATQAPRVWAVSLRASVVTVVTAATPVVTAVAAVTRM